MAAVKVKAVPYKEPIQARIEKAEGGFIVTKGYGDKPTVAKTLAEAQKIQAKLLK